MPTVTCSFLLDLPGCLLYCVGVKSQPFGNSTESIMESIRESEGSEPMDSMELDPSATELNQVNEGTTNMAGQHRRPELSLKKVLFKLKCIIAFICNVYRGIHR